MIRKVYHGWRDAEGTAHCDVNEKPLPLRLDLASHSPTGFEWGYGGSGPAQLALAILADNISAEQALRLHQRFKWAVIAKLDQDKEWTFSSEVVMREVARLTGEVFAR